MLTKNDAELVKAGQDLVKGYQELAQASNKFNQHFGAEVRKTKDYTKALDNMAQSGQLFEDGAKIAEAQNKILENQKKMYDQLTAEQQRVFNNVLKNMNPPLDAQIKNQQDLLKEHKEAFEKNGGKLSDKAKEAFEKEQVALEKNIKLLEEQKKNLGGVEKGKETEGPKTDTPNKDKQKTDSKNADKKDNAGSGDEEDDVKKKTDQIKGMLDGELTKDKLANIIKLIMELMEKNFQGDHAKKEGKEEGHGQGKENKNEKEGKEGKEGKENEGKEGKGKQDLDPDIARLAFQGAMSNDGQLTHAEHDKLKEKGVYDALIKDAKSKTPPDEELIKDLEALKSGKLDGKELSDEQFQAIAKEVNKKLGGKNAEVEVNVDVEIEKESLRSLVAKSVNEAGIGVYAETTDHALKQLNELEGKGHKSPEDLDKAIEAMQNLKTAAEYGRDHENHILHGKKEEIDAQVKHYEDEIKRLEELKKNGGELPEDWAEKEAKNAAKWLTKDKGVDVEAIFANRGDKSEETEPKFIDHGHGPEAWKKEVDEKVKDAAAAYVAEAQGVSLDEAKMRLAEGDPEYNKLYQQQLDEVKGMKKDDAVALLNEKTETLKEIRAEAEYQAELGNSMGAGMDTKKYAQEYVDEVKNGTRDDLKADLESLRNDNDMLQIMLTPPGPDTPPKPERPLEDTKERSEAEMQYALALAERERVMTGKEPDPQEIAAKAAAVAQDLDLDTLKQQVGEIRKENAALAEHREAVAENLETVNGKKPTREEINAQMDKVDNVGTEEVQKATQATKDNTAAVEANIKAAEEVAKVEGTDVDKAREDARKFAADANKDKDEDKGKSPSDVINGNTATITADTDDKGMAILARENAVKDLKAAAQENYRAENDLPKDAEIPKEAQKELDKQVQATLDDAKGKDINTGTADIQAEADRLSAQAAATRERSEAEKAYGEAYVQREEAVNGKKMTDDEKKEALEKAKEISMAMPDAKTVNEQAEVLRNEAKAIEDYRAKAEELATKAGVPEAERAAEVQKLVDGIKDKTAAEITAETGKLQGQINKVDELEAAAKKNAEERGTPSQADDFKKDALAAGSIGSAAYGNAVDKSATELKDENKLFADRRQASEKLAAAEVDPTTGKPRTEADVKKAGQDGVNAAAADMDRVRATGNDAEFRKNTEGMVRNGIDTDNKKADALNKEREGLKKELGAYADTLQKEGLLAQGDEAKKKFMEKAEANVYKQMAKKDPAQDPNNPEHVKGAAQGVHAANEQLGKDIDGIKKNYQAYKDQQQSEKSQRAAGNDKEADANKELAEGTRKKMDEKFGHLGGAIEKITGMKFVAVEADRGDTGKLSVPQTGGGKVKTGSVQVGE